MKIINPKHATIGVITDNADEFKKSIIGCLMTEESVPLIVIWYDKKMDKLSYAVGDGATGADEKQKRYLFDTMNHIVENINNGGVN